MSERVRAYVTGEPPDRVWTNDAGEVIAHEPGPLPEGQDYGRWFTVFPSTHRRAGQTVEVMPVPESGRVRVGSEREGWRARLANVERLLTAADGAFYSHGEAIEAVGSLLGEALAEVRSMIDGDEVPS